MCVASHLLTMACTNFVKAVETSRLVPIMLQKLPIILCSNNLPIILMMHVNYSLIICQCLIIFDENMIQHMQNWNCIVTSQRGLSIQALVDLRKSLINGKKNAFSSS